MKILLDFIRGTVTNVIDGDTFEMNVKRVGKQNKFDYNDKERIRIADINTPELPSSSGKRAKWALEKAILGKYVRCDIQARDSYGRLVSNVSISEPPIVQ